MAAATAPSPVRGIRFNPTALRRQMALRGLTAAHLAVESRISAPTMSAAMAGRRIGPQTVRAIATALSRIPTVISEDLLESA